MTKTNAIETRDAAIRANPDHFVVTMRRGPKDKLAETFKTEGAARTRAAEWVAANPGKGAMIAAVDAKGQAAPLDPKPGKGDAAMLRNEAIATKRGTSGGSAPAKGAPLPDHGDWAEANAAKGAKTKAPATKAPAKAKAPAKGPRKGAAKASPAKGAKGPKAGKAKRPARDGSKVETILAMLAKGATRKAICEAVAWPSLNLNQLAARKGLKLRKDAEGIITAKA